MSDYQFDFIKYADDYGIPYRQHNGNLSKGWMAAVDCPFCAENGSGFGKYHLGIPEDGNYGNCWACGGHSLKSITGKFTPDIPFGQLLKQYAGYVDIHDRLVVEHAKHVDFCFSDLGDVAKKYLYKRGFDPAFLVQKYGMCDGGFTGTFQYRIIIPIIHNGVLVAYQGRSYHKLIAPKYRFLSEENCIENPKHILYNLDNCKHDYVILTEGVFDCIRLAGDYCTNVCATMGIATSEEQVRLISDNFKSVYICFDPEIPAQERAYMLGKKLSSMGLVVHIVDTERDYDLGDTSFEEAAKLKHIILENEF